MTRIRVWAALVTAVMVAATSGAGAIASGTVIYRPTPGTPLAVNGNYIFHGGVGPDCVSESWGGTGGYYLGSTNGSPVTYVATSVGQHLITHTGSYDYDHDGVVDWVETAVSVCPQFALSFPGDDGNSAAFPPQPEMKGSGVVVFMPYDDFSQRTNVRFNSAGPPSYPIGCQFYAVYSGQGRISFPTTQQITGDGTWTVDGQVGSGAGASRIYGTDASTPINDIEFDIALSSTIPAMEGIGAYELITVCQMVETEWVTVDSPVTSDNPETLLNSNGVSMGGGDRIFPDLDHPDDPDDPDPTQMVTVRASIHPAADDVSVWLRVIDIDDPSQNGPNNEADEHDDVALLKGDDNNDPHWGVADTISDQGTGFSMTLAFTTSGVAETELRVGLCPGDNYKACASIDYDYIADINTYEVDGTSLADWSVTPHHRIDEDNFHAMPGVVLAVWRRLHVEYDHMSEVPAAGDQANRVLGDTVSLDQIDRSAGIAFDVGDAGPLDGGVLDDGSTGNGRFEGGSLEISGHADQPVTHNGMTDVFDTADGFTARARLQSDASGLDLHDTFLVDLEYDLSSDESVVVVDPGPGSSGFTADYSGGYLFVGGLDFQIDSSDASAQELEFDERVFVSSVTLRDDDDETLNPLVPNLDKMQEGAAADDYAKNRFAMCFIHPVHDGGGDLDNNEDDVAFELNVDDPHGRVDDDFDSDDDRRDRYWIAYVLGAYQPETHRDNDPATENGLIGLAVGPTGMFMGCYLYAETLRDWLFEKQYASEDPLEHFDLTHSYVVVHEIGHQFGMVHPAPGIMAPGSSWVIGQEMDWSQRAIRIIRSQRESPGRRVTQY